MDSRRICFERGKAFVFMPDEDSDLIIAEDPNGVVEHGRISDATVTRIWPDGRVDHFRRGDPEDLASEHGATMLRLIAQFTARVV